MLPGSEAKPQSCIQYLRKPHVVIGPQGNSQELLKAFIKFLTLVCLLAVGKKFESLNETNMEFFGSAHIMYNPGRPLKNNPKRDSVQSLLDSVLMRLLSH